MRASRLRLAPNDQHTRKPKDLKFRIKIYLGGGFKYVFFHPYLGKIPNLTNIFQMGWFNHQLARFIDFEDT